jgi:hypothetical protein
MMVERRTIRGIEFDIAALRDVRPGAKLTPGLAAFTGFGFLIYSMVKLSGGTTPLDGAAWIQIGVAAALAGVGAGLLVRARHFYLDVVTDQGVTRLAGLSKAEQREIADRLRAPDA